MPINELAAGGGGGTGDMEIATYDPALKASQVLVEADTVDNLASTSTTRPLSANQGKQLDTRMTALEGQVYEYEIFASLASGTSGTLTPPTGSTIRLDQYPAGGDCLIVAMDGTRPTDEPARTSGGEVITGTLTAGGAWTLSAAPASYPVALVYQIEIAQIDIGNIPLDIILQGTISSTTVRSCSFDIGYTGAVVQGQASWNSEASTMDVGVSNEVTLQLGQESHIRVVNNTGSAILNGTPVYLSGSDGTRPEISPASADSMMAPRTIAIATQDFLDGEVGFVTSFGMVRDLDTSAFALGPVYLGLSGTLTQTRPVYPATVVTLGEVVVVSATVGVIHVAVQAETFQKGFDVMKQPLGVVDRAQSTLAYDAGTRTVSITPVGSYWAYFNKGLERRISTVQSKTHTATTGGWYFYIDENDAFQISQTPWDIIRHVPLAYIYYNDITPDGWAFEERHGATRNPEWHRGQHNNIGTYYSSGLAASGYVINGTTDAENTFSIASGVIFDEDLPSTLTGQTDGAGYNLFYRGGVAGSWLRQGSTLPFPVGTTYPQYNQWTGATWQLTELANGNYLNVYVIATPAIDGTKQLWCVPGQQVYTTLANATGAAFASDVQWGSMPFVEFSLVHRFTYRTASSYTTTGKCRIEAYADLRGSTTRLQVVNGTATGFHDSLSGLQLAAAGVPYGHINDQAQTITGNKTIRGYLGEGEASLIDAGWTPAFNLHSASTGSATRLWTNDVYTGSAAGPVVVGRQARGTYAAPTNTLADDPLLTIGGRSYISGSGFAAASSSAIIFRAAEDATSATNLGGLIAFETCPVGAGARVEVARFTPAGYLGIGTDSPTGQLQIGRNVAAVDTGITFLNTQRVTVPSRVGGSNKITFKTSTGQTTSKVGSIAFKASDTESGSADFAKLMFSATADMDISAGFPTTAGLTIAQQIDDTSQLVGIGTVTPLVKLHVGDGLTQQTIRVNGGSVANAAPVLSVFRTGINEAVLAVDTTGRLVLGLTGGLATYTDANLASTVGIRMNTSGYLGLGTGNSDPDTLLNLESSTGTAFDFIHLRDSVDGSDFVLNYDGSGGYSFKTEKQGAGGVTWLALRGSGNTVIGPTDAALATSATDGFLYLPACAGAPTGAASAYTGKVPMVVDTTNSRLYFRIGSTWKYAALT